MIKKRTPARMARLVAEWRASGESGARFARRHHVPAWTFWYWCRKLPRDTGSDASGRPLAAPFVPVRVAADPDPNAIEVVLASGERVHVRAGAPVELLRAVLTALRSGC